MKRSFLTLFFAVSLLFSLCVGPALAMESGNVGDDNGIVTSDPTSDNLMGKDSGIMPRTPAAAPEVDAGTADEGSNLFAIILAVIVAIAILVLIALLLPRKRHNSHS